MAGSGGEANLEIIMSHSHKHYSALTVNGPGHLYGPPLREARKLGEYELTRTNRLLFLSLSLFSPPVLFEVSIRRLRCQVQGRAAEKAPAEERTELPAEVCRASGPRKPGLAPGGGRGWWPGALAAVGGPHLGQSGALPLFAAAQVSSAPFPPPHLGADRRSRNPHTDYTPG